MKTGKLGRLGRGIRGHQGRVGIGKSGVGESRGTGLIGTIGMFGAGSFTGLGLGRGTGFLGGCRFRKCRAKSTA